MDFESLNFEKIHELEKELCIFLTDGMHHFMHENFERLKEAGLPFIQPFISNMITTFFASVILSVGQELNEESRKLLCQYSIEKVVDMFHINGVNIGNPATSMETPSTLH